MKKLRLARIPLLLTLVVVQFSIAMTTVQAAPLPGTNTFTIRLHQAGAVRTSYPWTGKPQYHCDQLKAGQSINYDADLGSTLTYSIYPVNNKNCTVAPIQTQHPTVVAGKGRSTPLYDIEFN